MRGANDDRGDGELSIMNTDDSISIPAEDEDLDLTPQEQEELTEAEPAAAPVVYQGTDFDVEGLVRRLKRGDIVIPTFGHGDPTLETAGFQRRFVWRKSQMDRFIESLLLGFPIPGIMLVEQTDKRYLVLDGQQRLRTLAAYYAGLHQGREFALENVANEFKGLTYGTLGPEQRRTLDNTFLQATIVKPDGSTQSLEAVYQVFERLNSGGTQLTPHEIRIALYPGEFVDLLASLNGSPSWRSLYGPVSPRVRDQELILRIIALYMEKPSGYYRPLKKFLNEFLGRYRRLAKFPREKIVKRFDGAAELLLAGPGKSALRSQSARINAALTEALFVGLMTRLDTRKKVDVNQLMATVERLGKNTELAELILGSTASEESVRRRIDITTAAFAQI